MPVHYHNIIVWLTVYLALVDGWAVIYQTRVLFRLCFSFSLFIKGAGLVTFRALSIESQLELNQKPTGY